MTLGATLTRQAPQHYAVLIAGLFVFVLLACCLTLTDGHLVYSMDDPYIHLTLARRILQGEYGINPGAWAAPSSSVLWPLLLAPFSGTSAAAWIPLLINVACLLATVRLLERFFSQYCAPLPACVLALALAWGVNIFGVVFTGMEHSLQVLLVTVVSVSLAGLPMDRRLVLVCLVVLPWVRYEDLAITLPACVYLFATAPTSRERLQLLFVVTLSLAVLVGFSLFLRLHGLGFMPSSVLAKQGAVAAGTPIAALASAMQSLRDNFTRWHVFVFAVIVVAVIPALRKTRPHLIWLLLAATAPILLLGRFGSLGRYEVHYLTYVSILVAAILLPRVEAASAGHLAWPVSIAFLAAAPIQWMSTLATPLACRAIYEQQYQMGVIVRDFLKAPVAVNDLGLVSWLGNQRVLDMWGLGSKDVLDMRRRDPTDGWMASAVDSHDTKYVFIYSSWFKQIPQAWINVGQLRLRSARLAAAGNSVDLYATDSESARRLRAALENYQRSSALSATLLVLPAMRAVANASP